MAKTLHALTEEELRQHDQAFFINRLDEMGIKGGDDYSECRKINTHVGQSQPPLFRQTCEESLTDKTAERDILRLNETLRHLGLNDDIKQWCNHVTTGKCMSVNNKDEPCAEKIHFARKYNDATINGLGDCTYLSGCFNHTTCPFMHYTTVPAANPIKGYEFVMAHLTPTMRSAAEHSGGGDILAGLINLQYAIQVDTKREPAQWVNADVMDMDFSVLGKFDVVLMDPPWAINMKLPYRQMTDDDVMNLDIPAIQKGDGLIFLWITSRALEKGLKCLEHWGYKFVDSIVWAKTNQMNATVTSGRTGHWLNHMKEVCLVGLRGRPKLNRNLDLNVIVEQIQDTSHKPETLYGIIDRLIGTEARKIEIFGRTHNIRDGWFTVGNQLPGFKINDHATEQRWMQWHEGQEREDARKAQYQDQDPASTPQDQAPPSPPQDQAPPSPPLDQAPPSPPLDQAPPSPPLDQALPSTPLDQALPSTPLDQALPSTPLDQAPHSPPLDQAPPSPPLDQTPPSEPTAKLPTNNQGQIQGTVSHIPRARALVKIQAHQLYRIPINLRNSDAIKNAVIVEESIQDQEFTSLFRRGNGTTASNNGTIKRYEVGPITPEPEDTHILSADSSYSSEAPQSSRSSDHGSIPGSIQSVNLSIRKAQRSSKIPRLRNSNLDPRLTGNTPMTHGNRNSMALSLSTENLSARALRGEQLDQFDGFHFEIPRPNRWSRRQGGMYGMSPNCNPQQQRETHDISPVRNSREISPRPARQESGGRSAIHAPTHLRSRSMALPQGRYQDFQFGINPEPMRFGLGPNVPMHFSNGQYGVPVQEQYGLPAQQAYGIPAQKAYGIPAQKAYGVPVQQAYGVPIQQAYGARIQHHGVPVQYQAPAQSHVPPPHSGAPFKHYRSASYVRQQPHQFDSQLHRNVRPSQGLSRSRSQGFNPRDVPARIPDYVAHGLHLPPGFGPQYAQKFNDRIQEPLQEYGPQINRGQIRNQQGARSRY